MTRTRYLHLSGVTRPALFEDAAGLEPLVPEVLPSWPFEWGQIAPEEPPFAVIRPGTKRPWSIAINEEKTREWDAVDTLCDLVAELAWERLRARPDLLSLHAAALEFSGRLVVFPQVKRAGKSTLSIALARLGHRLFADDVLPVEIGGDGHPISGLSSGAAPRLRLPLPDSFSDDIKSWVAADPGPGNKRYKYVTGIPLAEDGASLPLGAIVVLERKDDAIAPALEPIAQGTALAQMIRQNFSRDQHSARILRAAEELTAKLPVFRLTYYSGEDAAVYLHDHPDLRDLPTAQMTSDPGTAWSAPERHAFDAEAVYAHARGLFESEVDGEIFLTDQSGAAIHRLNQGSVMIWRALSEPASLADATALISAAFPEVAPDLIAADTERTLRKLAKAGLILPAAALATSEAV